MAYGRDAWQRSVLYWDVMRQRGNQYLEHMGQTAPNVLSMPYETIMDGRQLPDPVNYGLLRIIAPDDAPVDPLKRPFLVVDPRACLLYTSPSPRDRTRSRMPSSA